MQSQDGYNDDVSYLLTESHDATKVCRKRVGLRMRTIDKITMETEVKVGGADSQSTIYNHYNYSCKTDGRGGC